jgi:hypothetical protein
LPPRLAAPPHAAVHLSLALVGNDDDLLITPDRELSDIVIRGNEIWVGNRRLVLKLAERS